ncbi:MAG: phosphatidylserine decarboxylase family protein [Candidatus Marinimicrobia bacterium]|nr:phosphatidylserine decarboxylase family protein [Candidatus Neomarinimicrobiota bacterium]
MIAKEGRIILIPLLLITLPIGIYAHLVNNTLFSSIYFFLGVLFLFCINFFRDPKRTIPMGENIIISPADGKIVKITEIKDPDVGDAKLVSIFLNVFNVHVNRVPIDGKVISTKHKLGKFLAAFDHKASDENEQVITIISHKSGNYKIKQIAGLIARRILCYAKEGLILHKGGRLGFIRFGSRTDLIMPSNVKINVNLGEKVKGGESVIGEL